jgi:hypothetical protein
MAKRGRPTKEPTPDDRAKVADLLAKKVPVTDIAAIFQMSAPTLRKYFRAEFFTGKKIPAKSTPTREITEALRNKVILYLGYDMSPQDVALAIGYRGEGEFENFESDYALELQIAKAVTRGQTIERLVKQSDGGLIGATNKLEALSRPTGAKAGAKAPTEHIGKKDAAQNRANEIAGQLRPIGPPTLKAVK